MCHHERLLIITIINIICMFSKSSGTCCVGSKGQGSPAIGEEVAGGPGIDLLSM